MTIVTELPLSRRLKAETGATHDRLDARIMGAAPFASRENYGRFLAVQYAFHRDLTPLYGDPALAALLPDLAERNRLERIGDDLADLGLTPPADDIESPAQGTAALGWLYVAEGSNLGAAFLFKAAAALGLGEEFGARHLAGHPDGRAQHWREFTGAIDALALSEAEQEAAIEGARAAFTRVHQLVDRHFA